MNRKRTMNTIKRGAALAAVLGFLLADGAHAYGSLFKRAEPGQAATRGAMFAANFYQPGGTGGQVVENTNIFTGQPSYTVPLYTLSARGSISFPLSLNFSGPTFPTMTNNNDRAPVGWIGAGWSMATPFVAVNHRGTFTYTDDMVMCNLGPYGGGQVLREPESGRYYVATNPSIRVEVDLVDNGSSPLDKQIREWRFIMPDGTRMLFGDAGSTTVVNSQRTVEYSGGMVTASPYNASSSKPFVYRWDLRRIEDDSRKTGLDFEYEKFAESLWGGKSYTRESYLKKVIRNDEFGNEVERVELSTQGVASGEYVGYFPNAAKTSQRLFETRRLYEVAVYHEGEKHVTYRLDRSPASTDYGPKGILNGIEILYGEEQLEAPGWAFGYRSGDYLLEDITLPSGRKERYEYTTKNLSGTLAEQESDGQAFVNENGQFVDPSVGFDIHWELDAQCDDRFCYEIIRFRNFGGTDTVYVRATHNTGNFFDTNLYAFHKSLAKVGASKDDWQVSPMGDYLIISNNMHGEVELWEWEGKEFRKINSEVGEAGDPMRSAFSGDSLQVVTGENFFAIKERQGSSSTRRKKVWVYLKDPETGRWKNLTTGSRTDSSCKLQNYPKGDNPQSSHTTDCFTWKNSWGVQVRANNRMLALYTQTEDIVYWYALSEDGSGLDSIGQLIPTLPEGVQESSPQNWNRNIVDFKLTESYLAIKSYRTGPVESRYDMFFYDGAVVKRIAALGWERDDLSHIYANSWSGTNHDRNVWISSDYFIHSNGNPNASQRIEYWKLVRDGADITFELSETIRSDVQDEGQMDIRVVTSPRYVAVEYYPVATFLDRIHPYSPPLTVGGSYQTWLYRIDELGEIDLLSDGAYSFDSWDIFGFVDQCSTKLWNMSFSPIDNILFGWAARGSTTCSCTYNCNTAIGTTHRTNSESESFAWDFIPFPGVGLSNPSQSIYSLSNRNALGMIGVLSDPDHLDTIYSRRYYFDGKSYASPTTTDVVQRFIRESSPDSLYPLHITEFDYVVGDPAYPVEFNHNSLTAHFNLTRVSQTGVPGRMEYLQYLDHVGQKLLADSAGFSGRAYSVKVRSETGSHIQEQNTHFLEPYHRTGAAPWPQGVSVIRPEKTVTRQWSDNGAYRTARTYYHAWGDSVETPLFTLTEAGDRVLINQSIMDGDGRRVRKQVAYSYPESLRPDESTFQTYKNSYLPRDSATKRYIIGHSEVDYDPVFTYQVNENIAWRDEGGDWNDEQLKAGPIPHFDPTEDKYTVSEVTRRDSLGLVLETRVEDGDDYKYTSYFYGGRAALPIGVVSGAQRDNVAILTAENVTVPQRPLDRDTLWKGIGYNGPTAHQSRTGRNSMVVIGTNGLYRKIPLRGVENGKFGYTVSAWIYGTTEFPPIVKVARHHANHTMEDDTTATPVNGSYKQNTWQRWEVVIPHDSLMADGMFPGESSGDYLQVTIGAAGYIYVGDVVCRPDNSLFSLTAYNERGQPTHVTDTHHRTLTHEYGIAGQYIATRDERGRIFEQTGFNKAGENLE